MSLAFIIRVSQIDTAAIPAAVRLAAVLAARETISEHEAPKAAQITTRTWDKIRPALSELFKFSGGKVSFARGENLDAFDLIAIRSEWQKEKEKKQGKYPTDPRILDLIDLGLEPRDATSLARHIVRTYSESHLLRAIKVTREKTPPPLEPKAFILSVVKGAFTGAGGGVVVAGMRPKRIKRFVRVANPEAAKTEFLGWEAPIAIEGGMTKFPAGQRRMVYRNRSGQIQLVAPRSDQAVPGVDHDPGVTIED